MSNVLTGFATITNSDLERALGGNGSSASNGKQPSDVPVDDPAHHLNALAGQMEQRRNNVVSDVKQGDWGGAIRNAGAYGIDALQGAVKLVTGGL